MEDHVLTFLYLGETPLQEVDNAMYLGMNLSAFNNTLDMIKERCNRGYSYLGSLTSLGFNATGLSPSTCATLWNRLCIPSILFSCENWISIPKVQYQMLENIIYIYLSTGVATRRKGVAIVFCSVCKLLKYNMVDTACLGNIIIQRINVKHNLPT